jgi:ParB family transcriptional regulator, chromosome partitioning protein
MQGVLSPILVRPLPEGFPEHFEIVTGARRFRAAQLAGLDSVPVRIVSLSDTDVLEIQVIENLQRVEIHPLEEARGFRALLQLDGYDVHKISSKIGKSPNYVAARLKLTDLVPEVAEAFLKNDLTVGHALLIAKLPDGLQKEALNQALVSAWNDGKHERVLKPIASLQAWIEQHVFLQLDKVPFPKDDATLVPEAGSCLECPKRTGFNKLLFPDATSDQCSDPNCFNNKLDKFVARQVESSPKLIQISTAWAKPQNENVLGRGRYVPIAPASERKNGKQPPLPEHVNCKSAVKAIVVDGIEKGQTVRVCNDPKCTTHFPPEPQTRAKQREAVRAQVHQRNEAEQSLFALRNRVLSEIVRKVSVPLSHAALQLVAYLVVKGIPYEQTIRLAKRRKLLAGRDAPSRVELEKKFVSLVKESDDAELARLIVEAGLIDTVSYAHEIEKGEPLQLAAHVYGVDLATIRDGAAKGAREKKSKPSKTGAKKAATS